MPPLASLDPITYVVGMHRSGTSLVMRTLDLLGIDLGDPAQQQPAGTDNPVGYFENRHVLELNDELLAALGGSWDRPPLLISGWWNSASMDGFRAEAAEVVTSCFATTNPGIGSGRRAVKDPRISLLVPFWQTVAPVAAIVLVVRCPTDVISSLEVRNGFTREHGAALWLRYTLAVNQVGLPLTVVDLDRFLTDVSSETYRLCDELGLPLASPDVMEQVRTALDPSLLHHRSGGLRAEIGAVEPGPVERMALRVWNRGDVWREALDADVAAALTDGHLGPAASAAELTATRADAAALREQLRRSNRKRRDLEARQLERRQ